MTNKLSIFLISLALLFLIVIVGYVTIERKHDGSPCWYLMNVDSVEDDDDLVVSCLGYEKETIKYNLVKFYIQIRY